jgi:teichoic acid transport system permease protein
MTATNPVEYSDVEYVFEPHHVTTPDLREYLHSLWERRMFMTELARADIRTARSKTRLGNLWSVLNPLFQAAIYYFLYTILRNSPQSRQFLPILIANFFFFGLTTVAISEGGGSIKRARGLMLNSSFPRAMLPLTTIYRSVREFIPSACVLAVMFPLVGGNLGPGLFVLPLVFALQIIMNIGIALLVATYVTLVSDGQNVMNFVQRILFFITPVIYPVTLLPANIKPFISWQPLFPLFSSYQAIFSGQTPNALLIFETALWAIALVVVGGRFFVRHEREFTMHI